MKTNRISNRLLGEIAILLFAVLAAYFIWDGIYTQNLAFICPGIGLILVVGAIIYLKRPQDEAEKKTMARIKAEFSTESQPQVFEIYKRLKAKGLGELFVKILDDAKGDLGEVKKLAGIAESVGANAFLENHW